MKSKMAILDGVMADEVWRGRSFDHIEPEDIHMILEAMDAWVAERESTKKTYTSEQVDLAYVTGVFNVAGLEAAHRELVRLSELGVKPHELFNIHTKTKP